MKLPVTAAVLPALVLALAACEVNVDENTAARIDNAAQGLENAAERAAAGAGNAAEGAAARVEGAADDLGNLDVDVDVGRDSDAAAGNGQ